MRKRTFTHEIYSGVELIGTSKFSFSTLGIAIEQAGELLGISELENISDHLGHKLSLFTMREVGDGRIFVVSISSKINLEIHTFSNEIICFKLSLALILVLCQQPSLVIDDNHLMENFCRIRIWTYSTDLQDVFDKHIPPVETLFNDEMQTAHMRNSGPDAHEMILVNPEYEIKSSLINNPTSKSSLYFLSTCIMGIKSHFYHSDVQANDIQRRSILFSVAKLFDYSNADDGSSETTSKFEIDIDKIRKSDFL